MSKKVCVTCSKEKDEEEFNWRYKHLGVRHKTCRECHHGFQDNWYQKNKDHHLENVRDRKKELETKQGSMSGITFQNILVSPAALLILWFWNFTTERAKIKPFLRWWLMVCLLNGSKPKLLNVMCSVPTATGQ